MTTLDMIDEVLGLVAGGTAVLLPAFILAVPSFVLLVGPLIVAAVALAAVAAVLASPVLLVLGVRKLMRWPAGTT